MTKERTGLEQDIEESAPGFARMLAEQKAGAAGDTVLLPCPFCGSAAERIDIDSGENAGGSCIACTRCLASSNVEFEFKENFVSNWNRRAALATPPAPQPGALDAGRVAACAEVCRKETIEYAKLGFTQGAGAAGDCERRIRALAPQTKADAGVDARAVEEDFLPQHDTAICDVCNGSGFGVGDANVCGKCSGSGGVPFDAIAAPAAQGDAPHPEFLRGAAFERGAIIAKLRAEVEKYDCENSGTDWSTGAQEFGNSAQQEWSDDRHELIDALATPEADAAYREVCRREFASGRAHGEQMVSHKGDAS